MDKDAEDIGFRITVEFDCLNMIDIKSFQEDFGSDPVACYRFISDGFSDSPANFSVEDRIVKIEIL